MAEAGGQVVMVKQGPGVLKIGCGVVLGLVLFALVGTVGSCVLTVGSCAAVGGALSAGAERRGLESVNEVRRRRGEPPLTLEEYRAKIRADAEARRQPPSPGTPTPKDSPNPTQAEGGSRP